MFLRFFLWWQYFKRFFYESLSRVFQGRSIGFYFQTLINVIGKWYLIIVPPSIYVVYKLYEALQNAGILDKLQTIVQNTLNTVIYIANYCFPKILNLKDMMSCIDSAPSGPVTLPVNASNYLIANEIFENLMILAR